MSEQVPNSSDTVQRSALLATFPWLTDFLLRKDDEVVKDERFADLFGVLSEFETALGNVVDLDAAAVRRLMTVVDTDTVNEIPTATKYPKKTAHTQLSHVLALYKLVDVLHALRGRSFGRNPLYSRASVIGIPSTDKDWLMPDWVKTLNTGKVFLSSLTSSLSSLTSSLSSLTSSLSSEPSTSSASNLQTRLFQDLHNLDTHHSGTKMLFNVQVAAIHLHFLFLGHKQPSELALPDIPSSMDQLQARSTGGAEEQKFVQSLMTKHELFQRRYPLNVALLISPLVLLVDKKIMSRCLDQLKLVMASKALGNRRPSLLVEIELRMWEALLSIAFGKALAYNAIQGFFSSVPWDKVAEVTQVERDFFKPDEAKSTSKISLLSVENEGTIDHDWPLAKLRPRPQQALPAPPTPSAPTGDERKAAQNPLPPASPSNMNTGDDTGPSDALDDDGDHPMPPSLPSTQQDDPDDGRPSGPQDAGGGGSAPTIPASSRTVEDTAHETPQKRTRLNPKPTKRNRSKSPPPNPNKKLKSQPKKKQSIRKMEAIPYQHIGSGTYLEPIDADAYRVERSITFQPTNLNRVHGSEITMFSPRGEKVNWIPQFHFAGDLTSFQTFERLVRRSYNADGLPPHIANPDQSCFAILSHAEYEKMTAKEFQTLFRDKHIVITDMPRADPPIRFDAAGLRHLTNLDARIDLQDQSIACEDAFYPRQLVVGTLRQVLEASLMPSGPILNALSFPLGLSGVSPSSICTEIEAWRGTEGLPFCPFEGPHQVHYPVSEMRWGLAATRGGRHWVHIDADGLATFIDPQCGGKWWIIICPPKGWGKHGAASIHTFLGKFDTNGVDQTRWGASQGAIENQWRAEAIYLTEGTRFIMRPNSPHLVFTTDHSIVLGGHFYSMSNIQPTFFGIIHCFMGNKLLTNTDHGKTRPLLLRIMQYVYKCLVTGVHSDDYSPGHVPDLTDPESLVDVLTLTNFCMLVNALDFRTYSFFSLSEDEKPSPREYDQRLQWDYNDVSTLDRKYFVYTRGLARNFWTWLECYYEVTYAGSTMPIQNLERELCWTYLTDQACALLSYKAQAEAESFPGLPFCQLDDLERQIDHLFEKDEGWVLKKPNRAQFSTLRISNVNFTVVKRNPPATFIPNNPDVLGMTRGDRLYKLGASLGFPSSKSKARPHILKDDEEEESREEDDEDEDEDEDFSPSKRRSKA